MKRAHIRRIPTITALLALLLLLTAVPVRAKIADPVFRPLVKALQTEEGLPRATVDRWFADPRVKFQTKLMVALLAKSEYSLDYDQFLQKKTVNKARAFARKHRKTLDAMEKSHGVEPGVVVAILTVETNLGSYTGRWSIFNVLASQAVLDTPEAQRRLASAWPPKQKDTLSSDRFHLRLKKKAAWARGELAALYHLCREEHCDPLKLKGSLAGALGWPQFVPSSVLKWGVDADQDGRRELHQARDAIHSVGLYLASHGWRPGLDRAAQTEVLLTYNHSQPYARTVLALAGKLR